MKVQVRMMLTRCFGIALLALKVAVCAVHAETAQHIHILYAEQKFERPPTLSGLIPVPGDLGLRGVDLAMTQNNGAGKFTAKNFVLETLVVKSGDSLSQQLAAMKNVPEAIIINAPAAEILKIADLPAMQDKLLFNASSRDENLREEDCRANLLHTLPTRSMLTDALAQFMRQKRWDNWLLLPGPTAADQAYNAALKRSAEKFAFTITAEKPWALEGDMRETAGTEIPLITQGTDYDVVMVADEDNDFGPLIAYNTDLPRPIAGTHGLVATGWSNVIEPWGAIQLQNDFQAMAQRPMREIDFAAYIAARAIGEAALRINAADPKALRDYIMSEDLNLSAYKGRGVTFRRWNGQLRQPIHLVTKETQVATAPFEEFLHEYSDLDTLGLDKPETKCTKFPEAVE
jgi:ABC transporter substrate binding protein (PQQ-dependent alcohol dehydrogenase system)